MTINSVSSQVVSSVSSTSPSTSQTSSTTDVAAASDASGVTVDISKPGQLMRELDSLAQTDPTKFKAVTAEIAQQLKDAASSQSGGRADFLSKLADRFQSASDSGNADGLKPESHGGHHHHGHHRMRAADGSEGMGSTGAGPDTSVGQTIQQIISSALGGTSSTNANSSTPTG